MCVLKWCTGRKATVTVATCTLVSRVLLLLGLLLGDTAGDCAASQHREGVTFLPLCYHSQVMRVGMGGRGRRGRMEGEGGERGGKGRKDEKV